jgi:hypothetical protein
VSKPDKHGWKDHESRRAKDQHGDRKPIEPSRRVRLAIEGVERLHDDLLPLADKFGFVIGEPYAFGMGLDVFDPETGVILTVARPHRRDIGEEPIVMSAPGVVHSITTSRQHQKALA